MTRPAIDLDDLLTNERCAIPGLGIVVEPDLSSGVLALKYLRVPFGFRGPGVAAGILTRLLDWCDRNGADLAVTPTGEYGSDRRRLVLALTRAGFEPCDWRETGHTMIRRSRRPPTHPMPS